MSRFVLALYLAALFLLPWSWFPPFPWLHESAQWSDAVFAVAAAAWALERAVQRDAPRLAPAHAAMLAYLGWAAVSHAAHGFLPREGSFKLLGLAELVTLAVVTGDVASRPGGTRAIGWTVALASLLTGGAAVAGFGLHYAGLPTGLLSGPGDLEPGSYARVRAGFPLPNLLGSFCIFAWGVVSHDEARLPPRLRRLAQAAAAVAAVLALARPLLGLALAALVRRADRPSRRRLAGGFAVAAALALAGLTLANLGLDPTRPWDARLRAEPSSRWLSTTSSWRAVVRAPLFGVGPGSLPGERWGFASDAHFTPLDVAGTLGLPALAAFAAIPLLLWRRRERPTDLAVWGILAGLALDALANDVEDFRHLWVAFGLAGAQGRPRRLCEGARSLLNPASSPCRSVDRRHTGPYTGVVAFRDRLVATIRAARPVLETEGVVVVGSEVPNLLEPGAAATLVVSQDLDLGVSVASHAAVKQQLAALRDFEPAADEPSVWTPRSPDLLELNFVGMDPAQDAAEAYLLEDDRLPLLVFGALSLVSPGDAVEIEGTRVLLPRPAGLLLEKLVTDRTGEKGERDLLVALGLLVTARPTDLDELERDYRRLRSELRHAVRSNLTILSLLAPRDGMPDPRPRRAEVADLIRRLEAGEPERR